MRHQSSLAHSDVGIVKVVRIRRGALKRRREQLPNGCNPPRAHLSCTATSW